MAELFGGRPGATLTSRSLFGHILTHVQAETMSRIPKNLRVLTPVLAPWCGCLGAEGHWSEIQALSRPGRSCLGLCFGEAPDLRQLVNSREPGRTRWGSARVVAILKVLASTPGVPQSAQALVRCALGSHGDGGAVRYHVHQLRRKLNRLGVEGLIVTDRRLGYALGSKYFKVDETGAEAAAATAVLGMVTGGINVVIANRPFLFSIREVRSGAVLFIGRILFPDGSS